MTVRITFNLIDLQLDGEELEAGTQNSLRQLHEFDAVEQADRVLDPHPLAGNKEWSRVKADFSLKAQNCFSSEYTLSPYLYLNALDDALDGASA